MTLTEVKVCLKNTVGLLQLFSPSLFPLQVIVAGHLFLQM